jgi:hypoxanthine-guanine phosphoribosyltransferase
MEAGRMKFQRGLSLISLILIGGLIFFVAVLGMKCLPAYMEFFAVSRNLKGLVASGQGSSMREIQSRFDAQAVIDDITSVQGRDLEINKSGNSLSISVSYERMVPLFNHVSLLFTFDASAER